MSQQRSAPSGSAGAKSVAVVIVTYGDRAHLLARVLDRLGELDAADRIAHIVVCDNGSAPRTVKLLDARARADGRVEVVRFPENRGSAGGFAAGIAAAAAGGAGIIWCLDDDTAPEPSALVTLLETRAGLDAPVPLVSLRLDRPDYRKVARGVPPERVFERPHSFLQFSILDLPAKVLRRLRAERDTVATETPSSISIPYAPYGGLLFDASLIEGAGLPLERLYLYADDHEFSARLAAAAGGLRLVPASRLEDLEPSWFRDRPARRWGSPRLLRSGEEASLERLYYSTRNRVYLERSVWGWKSHPLYRLNTFAYLALLAVEALIHRLTRDRLPWTAFRVIRRARRDAAVGRLGRVESFLEPDGEGA